MNMINNYTTHFVRAAMTLLALICFLTGIQADNVTVDQARQLAQDFLSSHQPIGKPRQAPGTSLQLSKEIQVKGLYVFNVENNNGFVIVSNDDNAIPILGFSDSGSFDPNHIPNNMLAWLQGYADQINWLKNHPNTKGASSKAQRRSPIEKTTIAPLITSTWNQDAPYNNLCPIYSGNNRSATGCVATAMAQVMNYHKWPSATTQIIPGYSTESYHLNLTYINAASAIDWDNIIDSYSGNYTTAQATAVATLMKYCGYSVLMDYGPESGSDTPYVADALKNYFDYKETTKFVSRTAYSTANWTDLIYYELANNRPVVYGGMSSGGGHEFVCDGYKYEQGDLFHINWGWGGQSDGYFVLSALDPDEQGIGGSSSTDGFNWGQDAVIGVQPSTGSGTMSDISPNDINLILNSMTLSSNTVIQSSQVTVTLNITNSSTEDYSGYIGIGRKVNNQCISTSTKYVTISAGESKNINYTYSPDETGTHDLVFFYVNSDSQNYTDGVVAATLTVTDGIKNSYVPVYGYYCDDYSRSQFVIPSTNLQDMLNKDINGMTFYSTDNNISWGSAEFDVYLSEVTSTTVSELTDWNTMEKVYAGSLSISDNEMVIEFDTPYQYNGGNLLVGINQTQSGSYESCYWLGKSVQGASIGGYGTKINQQNFLPNTTFNYSDHTSIQRPTNLTISLTHGDGTVATLSWTENGSSTSWEICLNDDESNIITTDNNPFSLTGLTPETKYTVKVRATHQGEHSDWSKSVTFTPTNKFELTVNDGTNINNFVPIYGYYVDDISLSQFIIPANQLTNIQWATITNLTFYASQSSIDWDDAKFEVYMSEVSNTTFTSGTPQWDDMTKVMNAGTLTVSDNKMLVTLDTPYLYEGGNLMIGIKETTSGSFVTSEWYGINTTENTAIGNVSSSGSTYELKHFLPKTTISYEPGEAPTCFHPTSLTQIGEPTNNSVQLSWTPGTEDQDAWQICINGDETHPIDVNTNPYTLTGLNQDTRYTVKVRGNCGGGDVSRWSNEITFKTQEQFLKPTAMEVTNVTPTTATANWTGTTNSYDVRYAIVADGSINSTNLQYDDGVYTTSIGTGDEESSFYWAVMYPAGSYSGTILSKVSTYDLQEMTGTVSIYNDGDTAPSNLLATKSFELTGSSDFVDITFDTQLNINDNKNLWIVFYNEGIEYPAAACKDTNEPNNRWISMDGSTWEDVSVYVPDYGWMIRATINDVDFSANDLNWNETTVTDTNFPMTGLTPESNYVVQVRSNYDGDNHSTWVNGFFTTCKLVILEDNATNNTETVNANNGKTVYVTLNDRTLYKDGNWNTLTLPFNVDLTDQNNPLAGATARELVKASITETTLYLTFSDGVNELKAGKPYIIKWEATANNIENPTFADVVISNRNNDYDNNIDGEMKVRFLGNYDLTTIDNQDKSILIMGSANNLYYPNGQATSTIGACRACFKIGSDDSMAPTISNFNIDFGNGETTGIVTLKGDTKERGTWYTVNGMKLNGKPNAKGVYLFNGQKKVIK